MENEPAVREPPSHPPSADEGARVPQLVPVSSATDSNSQTRTNPAETLNREDGRTDIKQRNGERIFLYVVITIVVIFLLAAVGWFSLRATESYGDAAQAATAAYTQGKLGAQESLAYRFVFARAQDAALIKGGALLLSFLVVVLGALMVLEGSQAFYKFSVEGDAKKSALETSSPGLVMISLGLALTYGVIAYKTDIDVTAIRRVPSSSGSPSNAAGSAGSSIPSQPLDPDESPLPKSE